MVVWQVVAGNPCMKYAQLIVLPWSGSLPITFKKEEDRVKCGPPPSCLLLTLYRNSQICPCSPCFRSSCPAGALLEPVMQAVFSRPAHKAESSILSQHAWKAGRAMRHI